MKDENKGLHIIFVICLIVIFFISFLVGRQYEHNHIDKKYIIVKVYNPRGYITTDTFPYIDTIYRYGNNFDSNHAIAIGKNNNSFNYVK